MRKSFLPIAFAIIALGLATSASAQAAFSLRTFDVTYTNQDGSPALQAGSHPYAMKTTVNFAEKVDPKTGAIVNDGSPRDLSFTLPPGLVGDRSAVPYCSTEDFLHIEAPLHEFGTCPDETVVGVLRVGAPGESGGAPVPAVNLRPPFGAVAKIGFIFSHVPIALLVRVNPEPPYNLEATLPRTSQIEPLGPTSLTLWGNPADPAHDDERGDCVVYDIEGGCPVGGEGKPFLTLPRSCTGPLVTGYEANSWEEPDVFVRGISASHDNAEPPRPYGMGGCNKLSFDPTISAQPTTKAAQSPTGLDFSLDVKADEGLGDADGLAKSDFRRAVVTLPEGFSTNPSLAEGLNVCSEAGWARETPFSEPGAGCPSASKIGSVEVETPLLDENVNGAIFAATPYENPVGSLLALYMVIKNPKLGIVIKQALKVETDPLTGRITTVADDIPQLPFSHFRLHFREGTRSPLASPPGCGTYNAQATLYPWSGSPPVTTTSAFQIITGPGAGACPSGGTPPFHPDLEAGTLNNAAGHYSPFNVRLSRHDGEQEFTHFSIKLPPGLVGKLAGIPFCSDAAIAVAKARTGAHGGAEEIASPSCPKASEVGRTLAGAGVGPSLTYAPGKVYLAGPYNGSALSIAAITAAKVGPFDLGTVVVRSALKVNPETAEVFVDATGSDPIPHIIKGIPVHLRDIRVYVDRPDFVLNPTSCKRTSTASTVLGSGLSFASEADDQPVTVTSPFQAADCASLGFAPKLRLSLKGGTKRGDNPRFKAVLKARPGDSNIGRAQVTLPHSEFLDQSHIKTVCTRVQFKQGSYPGEKCPAGSIYGFAKAVTPLLDEPIQGPVYLRSSSHPLPDLVAALHSARIDINLVGRIDSVKNGRIRNTFESVPDAPVKTFTLEMRGGKKGLLVNSANLCRSTNRAIADFEGQNGRRHLFNPALVPDCSKPGRSARNRH